MLDAAQHLAAGLHHHIGGVLFQVLAEGIVGGEEEPGLKTRLDGGEPGDVGLPKRVVGIMHGVGTAGLVAEADRGRARIHHDLVARFRDLAGGQRGRGRRHVVQHLDALVIEHVARDAGGKVGLVEMIGGDDLDLASQHLAAKILHRHLRGGLRARPGDIGVKPGHVENAAELERRLALRQCRRRRHRQHRGEHACNCSLHGRPPLSAAALPAALNFALPTIMPHGINSGKALTFSVKRNDATTARVGWVERSETHQLRKGDGYRFANPSCAPARRSHRQRPAPA